jgi:hypothetical protein
MHASENSYVPPLRTSRCSSKRHRFEQAKCSFGIPRFHPRCPQTDYAAFLLLHDAAPFGDELLGAAKIVFAWSRLFFIPGHVMVRLRKSATGPKD